MAKFAKIIQENNEKFLIKKFISFFKRKVENRAKKRFSLVLAGGESPIKLYRKISRIKNMPWRKIDFFISDERYVKENSRYSNFKMCKKNLLNKINILNNQIYFISTDKKSIKDSTDDYEKKIKKYFLNKKIIFDLVLLGIGNDGHIASLFKKNISKKFNRNVNFVKEKSFYRVTLTLKCLNNAKTIFMWVPGKSKSNIVKKILLDNKLKYPVSFLRKKNNFLFYCN